MAFFKILFLPFFLFLSGCSFLDLKDDLEKQDQLVTISGKIILDSRSSAPIMVLLIKDDQNRPTLNHYRKIEKSNEFSFIVEPGIYRIYAYEDANRDEKFNPAERAAHTPILTMSVPGMHQKTDIVIKSSADKDLLDKIDVLKKTGLVDIVNARRYLGQVTSLDADCFSQENVSKGLWQPYAFATEVPLGIFFLEKYDPNKKPVLFIHGISGSPTQ
ncbi:MAG: hypothetical protein U9Q62_12080, partial [Campylobacterota bacterium]|nr:hypothetical protein [Campylobacterota bacterium]